MTFSLRSLCGAAVLLGLLPAAGRAQVVQPLGAEPPHALVAPAAAQRPTALTLPFFDDFSRQKEGAPDGQRWETAGGALINNRFPRRPISRGVATLDGLNGKGQPRGVVSMIGDADTLTSQALNLGGLSTGSNVFLSFFWQAGSVIGPPSPSGSRPIALYVDFKDVNDQWQQVWQLRSPGDTTNFRFKALPVNQAGFLHPNFQFRFRVSGYLYNNRDAWSMDYVRLDRNRTATDSSYRDIALSKPLPSALKRFAAMPVVQFNLNAAQELTDRTATSMNNLDAGPAPTPISWEGYLDVVGGGSNRFLQGNRSLDAGLRQQPIIGNPRLAAVPTTPAAKQLRQRLVLLSNETNPLTLPNDTITRLTDLTDYYAYDDGTAEATVSLPPASNGPASYHALRFDLNRPDQIRAIRLAPLLLTAGGRTITINIWDDNGSGQPAATPKATKSFTIPTTLPPGQTFIEIPFDAPVPVSGRFYAGYGHPPTSQFVQFLLDLNNAPPANSFFINSFGAWSPASTASSYSPAGSLMLRPVTTGVVTATAAPAEVVAQYQLYPNPTPDGWVQIAGSYARAAVLDAVGRVVWEQPAAEAGQPVVRLPLPAGLYFVRLTRADGLLVTKRLSITQP
ncbi:T9SS type A sorting domain-containing protein [Hymenobacter metallilatus]|uniref:T9SS C-terminal target domain-containing protein n=1 Tax=Hymenobacter metallilatus TaxID=2493666 RepID=A0A3R9NG33_9BACT|nr:T9SS type A sorting domain-containing protein [Hymenobacter metallilatus]RSK31677.1 T9SS C-terminal target domain-containing protein [Hymenobacter metallilatus]